MMAKYFLSKLQDLTVFLFSKQNSSALLSKRNFGGSKHFNKQRMPKHFNNNYIWLIAGGATALTCGTILKMHINSVRAESLKKRMQREEDLTVKLTARERRFIKFASVDYNEQLYMTPQDFLDSVVEQEPRPRLKRKTLTQQDLNKIRDITPSSKKGSVKLFRSLRDKGIISFTEYLFLLSVLTKPVSGFRIAFNMFDTDGNQRVDKNEFLVIIKILSHAFKIQPVDEETKKVLMRLISCEEQFDYFPKKVIGSEQKKPGFMERIFSGAWKEKRGQLVNNEEELKQDQLDANEFVDSETKNYVNDQEGLQRQHMVPTTLQLHFFGKRGTGYVTYDQFYKFMDNLQTEVLEIEFNEFSKGLDIISELDFAKIMLRYTYLATDTYDIFLDRLLERVKDQNGITFTDFRDFCRFLNNLDDFTIAMRIYTLADRAISKDEFIRAVKICTGFDLSDHLVDTVFAIFDEDGDGLLSYKEFIAIMKDRLHRGFKSVAKAEGWDAFKYCVRQETKMLHKSMN